jgi:hypothetical protein
VEAVRRTVDTTEHRAAIGLLEDVPRLIAETAETQVEGDGPDVKYRA